MNHNRQFYDLIDTAFEFVKFHDRTEFYQCGCCDHWHPVEWNGDCRDDKNRFTFDQLLDAHGPEIDLWD